MDWVLQIKDRTFSSPSNEPHLLSLPIPPPLSSSQPTDFTLNNKVSPSILLIIIILAVIFFISGVLHLLVRLLFRPSNRNPGEIDNFTALQGQLQQLFHLHDSGVDQSFIDTLPVFNYKDIIGIKDPFDCAVCLSEFEFEDKLRLLPKCSHAFHMNCIDTWLLSHSTCPLCRASLVSDFPQNTHCSPVVMILESGNESSRERVFEREDGSAVRVSTHYDDGGDGFRLSVEDPVLKSGESGVKLDGIVGEEIVSVKLGKFRNVGGEDEGSSEINGEVRRCFSMGSFTYIMDESSSLKVAIKTSMKNPGHRLAMSECGRDSRRELFNGFEAFKVLDIQSGCNENKSIVSSNRDSFSISKIWLRGRKDQPSVARMESSRRAYSFRYPVAAGETNAKNGGGGGRRRMSEIESQCNSLSFEDDHPSFGRTLLWLMGRQNKVVKSPFSSDV